MYAIEVKDNGSILTKTVHTKGNNVKYSFAATTQQTIYTAPSGGDFDFAIVKSFLACDHGNQQTNLDVSITDTSSNEFFIYKQHNIAHTLLKS